MTTESDILQRLRRIVTHPGARGLLDDVALLDGLVITHDSIAEGVHFLPGDPPAGVGWKLAAVNLSDLAGKGAEPAGALLSLAISGDGVWECEFLTGFEQACETYGLPLIGGDTITLPAGAPRVLGMTVIGRAGASVPSRSGAVTGDVLWLVGTVGDAAAGLEQLRADPNAAGALVDVYRRPVPQLGAGRALAQHAHAMMDVSDGLLLDASRMIEASGCGAAIELDRLPLSPAFLAERGDGLGARLFAATGGDDYALLAAVPADLDAERLPLPEATTIRRIGSFSSGAASLALTWRGEPVELPERLGFEHSSVDHERISAPPLADRP